MNEPALELTAVSKTYRTGTDGQLQVLRGVNLVLNAGETVALVAPSGAGKSTLLHVAGLLDRPDKGEIRLAGRAYTGLRDSARTAARRREIGFVYQFHHLLPEFSALENVLLPQLANGISRRKAIVWATELLDKVGLTARQHHRPAELSGGEAQRVALCRALANRPKVLLADEPTGNLDPETATIVFDLLVDLMRQTGLAALIATHNPELARRMDRVARLENGHIHPVD